MLRKASVQQCRSCILLPDESGVSGASNADERTILAALAVKSIAGDAAVRAAILKAESEQHLRRAEVDDVVLHGEFTGFLLAASSDSGGLRITSYNVCYTKLLRDRLDGQGREYSPLVGVGSAGTARLVGQEDARTALLDRGLA